MDEGRRSFLIPMPGYSKGAAFWLTGLVFGPYFLGEVIGVVSFPWAVAVSLVAFLLCSVGAVLSAYLYYGEYQGPSKLAAGIGSVLLLGVYSVGLGIVWPPRHSGLPMEEEFSIKGLGILILLPLWSAASLFLRKAFFPSSPAPRNVKRWD